LHRRGVGRTAAAGTATPCGQLPWEAASGRGARRDRHAGGIAGGDPGHQRAAGPRREALIFHIGEQDAFMQPVWDLIVVGAGILGTSHAYHAARRGWRVLLLERGDWPGEASVRNFGTLMAGSLAGEWRRRGMESIALYRELASLAGFTFSASGSLYHVPPPADGGARAQMTRGAP